MRLVSENADKSWTKISMEFGNRYDVQCRYRYQQLLKDNQTPNNPNSQNDEIDVKDNTICNEKPPTINNSSESENYVKNIDTANETDDNKFKKEARILIPSLIPLHNQLQNQLNLHAELPKLYIPSITDNLTFPQQTQTQSKVQSQQESSILPKISLPKIYPSIFMEYNMFIEHVF